MPFPPHLETLLHFLAIAGGSFAALYGLYWLIFLLIIRRRAKPDSDLARKERQALHLPMLFLSLTISLSVPLLFLELPDGVSRGITRIVNLALIGVIAWTLIEAVGLVKYLVLRQYNLDEKDNLKARKVYTQFRIIERVANVIILIVAISLILMSFDSIRKIGVSLIASAGIAGIILGFAAQKVLGGLLAGIQIAITQPIRIEDAVVVEGEWGWVEELNLTYVVVRIWDKRRLVLPTTYFIEKPFQNWTRTSGDIVGSVFLHVDYRMPMNPIREELDRILDNTDLWDRKAKVLQVTDAKERSVEVRILVSAETSPQAWDLRVHVREQLIDFMQREYPEYLPTTRLALTEHREEAGRG